METTTNGHDTNGGTAAVGPRLDELTQQVAHLTSAIHSFSQSSDKTLMEKGGLRPFLSELDTAALRAHQRLRFLSFYQQFLDAHEIKEKGRKKKRSSDDEDDELERATPDIYHPFLARVIELTQEYQATAKEPVAADAFIHIAEALLQIATKDQSESRSSKTLKLAESLARDIFSTARWRSHPHLVARLVNSAPSVNRLLARFVLSSRNYDIATRKEMTRNILVDSAADRDVSKYVLAHPPFDGPEGKELVDMILNRRLKGRILGDKVDLKDGTIVQTEGYKLEVLCCGGKGNTGAVYKARTPEGKIVGLKVCVKYAPEQIISMQRELKKMEYLSALQVIPHTAILEAGDDYCVKEWAEGITGVEWFRIWTEGSVEGETRYRPCDLREPGLRGLIKLFRDTSTTCIYLQNFKPQNLLWERDKNSWIVVDYGGHKTMANKEAAFFKYCDKFDRMWNKKKSIVPPFAQLVQKADGGEDIADGSKTPTKGDAAAAAKKKKTDVQKSPTSAKSGKKKEAAS